MSLLRILIFFFGAARGHGRGGAGGVGQGEAKGSDRQSSPSEPASSIRYQPETEDMGEDAGLAPDLLNVSNITNSVGVKFSGLA